MNEVELRELISRSVTGDITPNQHEQLQTELKVSPHARAIFREHLDVEAALRTWAAEDREPGIQPALAVRSSNWLVAQRAILALAATTVLVASGWWLWSLPGSPPEPPAESPREVVIRRVSYVGIIGAQHDCVWRDDTTLITGSKFLAQKLALSSGVAELRFDSGTNVILEGPCEFEVRDVDAGHLMVGNVVVHVTELSDGFTLTTPEATIVDEGTEYAVSLTEEAAEVYVFDGAVLWENNSSDKATKAERIDTGEARRYLRSRPSRGARIPFGQRRFARRIDAFVREEAGRELLAYDGFENLAGRVQRDRSGFGWLGGWQSGRPGHGHLGEIVDAPSNGFGIDRSGRRLLRLSGGDAIVRDFENSHSLEPGNTYYLSFLMRRFPANENQKNTTGGFFELSVINDGERSGRRSRKWFTFGISSERQPFIKSVGAISSAASTIDTGEDYLCVSKILVAHEQVATALRVYHTSESIDEYEPKAWTVIGGTGPCDFRLAGIRLSAAAEASYEIDELRLGKTWRSVTSFNRLPTAIPKK